MLLEVPFINGYNEFIEYFSKEVYIDLDESYTENEYVMELIETEVVEDSLSYTNILNSNIDINISLFKEDDIYYLKINSTNELKDLKLNVQFTYKNINPKNLYSVDYDLGIIHFSEKTPKDFKIEYEFDNVVCTGKSAEQLLNEDFNYVSNTINIKNYKENSSIYFLYKKDILIHRNLTPVIQDLKLNYIIKDDMSI